MAEPKHLQLLQPALLSQARAAQPDLVLDLSDADLPGAVLDGLDLRRANLRGANLRGARMQNSNLTDANLKASRLTNAIFAQASLSGADLSDADCTSASFVNANLKGAKATSKTILNSADFRDAEIDKEFICRSDIAGVNLAGRDLSGIDLSDRDLSGANLNGANLSRANLKKSKLPGSQLNNANLTLANFSETNLTSAGLPHADMSGADLRGATLTRANLMRAELTGVTIDGANFSEAALDGANLGRIAGARLAKNLITTRVGAGPLYFDTAIRGWPERWIDWERIRIFGRLPLFGASYTGLIIIPAYVYFLDIYNGKIQVARTWVEQTLGTAPERSAAAANKVLANLHPEPIPDSFFLLFVSTLFLAIAATIYTVACPSRIKTFSRDQWCDELGHSLIHYWPDAWKWRWLRLVCAGLYAIGGIGALWVLGSKLWHVAVVLFRSEFI